MRMVEADGVEAVPYECQETMKYPRRCKVSLP